jgi:hypothetical protein
MARNRPLLARRSLPGWTDTATVTRTGESRTTKADAQLRPSRGSDGVLRGDAAARERRRYCFARVDPGFRKGRIFPARSAVPRPERGRVWLPWADLSRAPRDAYTSCDAAAARAFDGSPWATSAFHSSAKSRTGVAAAKHHQAAGLSTKGGPTACAAAAPVRSAVAEVTQGRPNSH